MLAISPDKALNILLLQNLTAIYCLRCWIKSLHSGTYFMTFSYDDFFFKANFFKKNSGIPLRLSNSLDPEWVRHLVGPDLVLNCFQKLSADSTWADKELISTCTPASYNTGL